MTARTTVTQRFANPTPEWQEGVYVFPLPEKAAGEPRRENEQQGGEMGGEDRGEPGAAGPAGAPEHFHDERRAHRARRGNHRHDRVSGDLALRHRRFPPALPDGSGASIISL